MKRVVLDSIAPDGVPIVRAAVGANVDEFKKVTSVVTRGSDEESRCARYVYGGAVVEPGDYDACVAYWEALKSDPAAVVTKTLSTYVLGEQLAAGALCSSVLATNPYGWAGCQVVGHFLGASFGEWLQGGLASLGLTDCRDQGPGEAEQARRIWDAVVAADRQGAHMMGDPGAPAAFWELAVGTAHIWVADGLENCRDASWWAGAKSTLEGNLSILSEESAKRARDLIVENAKRIAEDEVRIECSGDMYPVCQRGLEASFAIAVAENELETKRAIARIQSNLANYQTGTLIPSGDEEKAWMSSALRQERVAEEVAAGERKKSLIASAIEGGGPFSAASKDQPSGGASGWWYVAGGAALAALAFKYRKKISRKLGGKKR